MEGPKSIILSQFSVSSSLDIDTLNQHSALLASAHPPPPLFSWWSWWAAAPCWFAGTVCLQLSAYERAAGLGDVYCVRLGVKGLKLGRLGNEISLRLMPTLLPYLIRIFKNAILTCTYPDTWKRALVIPLKKVHFLSSSADTNFWPLNDRPNCWLLAVK